MQAVIFFIVVFGAVTVLALFLRKASSSGKKTPLAREDREAMRELRHRRERLATPGNNRLANNSEVWQARRQHFDYGSGQVNKAPGLRYAAFEDRSESNLGSLSRTERHQPRPSHPNEETGRADRRV